MDGKIWFEKICQSLSVFIVALIKPLTYFVVYPQFQEFGSQLNHEFEEVEEEVEVEVEEGVEEDEKLGKEEEEEGKEEEEEEMEEGRWRR